MDKALKQRLTGAVILIALAIIFLPMLLDGDNRQQLKSQIELPQQPVVNFPNRRMPIGQQKPRPGPSVSQAADIVPQDELLPESSKQTAEGVAGDAAADVEAGVGAGEGIVIAPLKSPAQRQESSTTSTSSESQENKQSVVTPSKPRVKKEEVPAIPVTGGLWKLQVASFSGQSNAEKLMVRLRRTGYQANIDSLIRDKTTLYRVLVPGYSDRSAANLAALSISKQIEGVNPKAIPPESTVDDPVVSNNEVRPGGRWVVQMGIFGQLENAEKLIKQLSQQGYTAYREKSGNAYKVMVGPILSRTQALKQRDAILSKIKIKGLVKEN
ncbi:MAG: SPOR domain-containing protein [Xanthomonadales bacterium]|nr:SPOR domain-containing protein [Xanthomonadales bacterium]